LTLPARRRARIVIQFVLCAVFALAASPGSARADAAGLFGTRELYSADLAPFSKWDGVVARTDAQMQDPRALCRAGAGGQACIADWWQGFITQLARLPLRQRVTRANEVLNRVRYVSAETNWHDPDHWETPFEFLTRGGQCQDYAIAKFMALAASGVPQSALRLVVVHDSETALDHAITVVYVDGDALVLDNQVKEVTPAAELARYVPYYSINRTGWWYHVPVRPSARFASARWGAAAPAN
jgi:predicted transglutaminase-like cysteine proteinase